MKISLLLCDQVTGRLFNLSTDSEEEQKDWISAIKHSLKVIQDIKVPTNLSQTLGTRLVDYPAVAP